MMSKIPLRPQRLHPGSRVAVVSLSGGLAASFPGVFERGLDSIRKLGLEPVSFPTTKMSGEELYRNPTARVRDLHDALYDRSVAGIVSAIGGYESVRLLPRLRARWFRENPKLILGSSDATTYLCFGARAGLRTFYGPSVMAGFSQMDDLPPEFPAFLRRFLFSNWSEFELTPFPAYTHGYTGWTKDGRGGVARLTTERVGWHVLQGSRPSRGVLWGGCIEVLEFIKATAFWPTPGFFDRVVLFLETSEEKPPPNRVGYMLRNYGVAGVLMRLSGLIIGRPKDYSVAEREELDALVHGIVSDEFGATELPVFTDVDIGHTDPSFILPIGGVIELRPAEGRLRLIGSPFSG